ncbi:chloramphenicol-sensitive protein RarD [Pedobacter westerhofensis]|uniref:Chloramphenicol-sensitive protein RarD n=1 Tax=Pedobacter westerhofensis TaxID=425512 RepID=A0A521FBF2_9SPHI|nr:EamA family transporter [Pedobacter westerhofensis]SMO93522.1 chloramphenicol-sensitive protein RarD [Pedobacter westerhofensis]
MKDTKYYLAAIISFTVWGFFSLVLKPIHSYPSIDILFYRVFSCAVLMLLIVLLFKRSILMENAAVFRALPVKGKLKTLGLNIGGGLLLTANWFSFIYVLNHISVKATSLAYLVCPILTTLLAFFILKEKLSKAQWASVALSIIGCVLLSYSSILDMSYSMIIGLSYAMYLVSQKENKGFDKFISLTFQIVLSALILLPFYPVYSGPVPVSFKFYFYIELIAVAFTIIPLLLNLFALKRINSSTVGMLLNINPLIAFCLAAFVYHEHLDHIQMAAYGIIFFAILVFNSQLIFSRKTTYQV